VRSQVECLFAVLEPDREGAVTALSAGGRNPLEESLNGPWPSDEACLRAAGNLVRCLNDLLMLFRSEPVLTATTYDAEWSLSSTDLTSGVAKYSGFPPPPPSAGFSAPTLSSTFEFEPSCPVLVEASTLPVSARGWEEAQRTYVEERKTEDLSDRHPKEIDRVLREANRHLTTAGLACHPTRFDRLQLNYLLTGPWKLRGPDGQGLSQRSRSYNVCLLNGFLQANDNLTIKKAKLRFPRAPVRRLDYLKSNERRRLLDTAERMGILAHLMVALEMLMGLRRSEVLRLTLRDLYDEEIWVHAKGRLGGKVRKVPYHDEVRRILPEFLRHREQEIAGHSGPDLGFLFARKLKNGTLKVWSHDWTDVHLMVPALTAAGVKRPDNLNHMLRRTFGRMLWDQGVPIEKIAYLMGHEDTRTTIRYLGLDQEDARASMAVLNRAFPAGG
jgi:integrase